MPLTPNVAFTSVSFGEIEFHCFLTGLVIELDHG